MTVSAVLSPNHEAVSVSVVVFHPDRQLLARTFASLAGAVPAQRQPGMSIHLGHPEAGLLAPAIVDNDGQLQYLCRQYPSVVDLFVRGFMPGGVRQRFEPRLARYEMRMQINERDTT